MTLALVDRLRALPPDERRAIYAKFSAVELSTLEHEWSRFWAREDQLAPSGPWRFWVLSGGRGSGKTRSAAEWVNERVRTGQARRVHLIGATADDARVTMLEGDSGILACSPPDFRPVFTPSIGGGTLEWPNGARGRLFSAERPKRLRGPQCDTLWCDDVAAWGLGTTETWNMAMLGFRLGRPKCVVSTTPIAVDLIVSLLSGSKKGVVVTRASTHANKGNLAPEFFEEIINEFEGTDFGEQEIEGKMMTSNPRSPFAGLNFAGPPIRVLAAPRLTRIIVAIDPAITLSRRSDETGILVMGLGRDEHIYVLEDLSGRHAPEIWADLAVDAYDRNEADAIVAETNRGGDLVSQNIRAALFRKRQTGAAAIDFKGVSARRGKQLRAGPLRTLYAGGRMHHVGGFPVLEKQARDWDPTNLSAPDDRIDALVHGAHELASLGEDQVDHAKNFEGLTEANADAPGARWGWTSPATPKGGEARSEPFEAHGNGLERARVAHFGSIRLLVTQPDAMVCACISRRITIALPPSLSRAVEAARRSTPPDVPLPSFAEVLRRAAERGLPSVVEELRRFAPGHVVKPSAARTQAERFQLAIAGAVVEAIEATGIQGMPEKLEALAVEAIGDGLDAARRAVRSSASRPLEAPRGPAPGESLEAWGAQVRAARAKYVADHAPAPSVARAAPPEVAKAVRGSVAPSSKEIKNVKPKKQARAALAARLGVSEKQAKKIMKANAATMARAAAPTPTSPIATSFRGQNGVTVTTFVEHEDVVLARDAGVSVECYRASRAQVMGASR